MVMAFNAFWDCNAGVAEYPGVGEGTFLQGCAVVQNVFEQANGDGNRLIRMAYGPFSLGRLEPGELREVRPEALKVLGLKS